MEPIIALSAQTQPRAYGDVHLTVKSGDHGTALEKLRQEGSLKTLFPRPNSGAFQAVLINTAGGITGGDRFSFDAQAAAGTALTITSQAAERAYRAQPGGVGTLQNQITIGKKARVNWLPQETILFEGSALRRSLRVEMDKDAAFLMVEPLIFGRIAMGEKLRDVFFSDRIEIWREGQIAYLDAVKIDGDADAQMAQAMTANGAGAMASLVYIHRDAQAQLLQLRPMLGDSAGVSLIGDDMLVLRLMAPDSYLLRQTLMPILNHLTENNLPRCWMT